MKIFLPAKLTYTTSSVPGARQTQVDSENLLDLDARVWQISFGIQISEGFLRQLLMAERLR